MRFSIIAASLVICGLAAPASARDPQDKGKTLQETFEQLLPGIGSDDLKARETAQNRWQEICVQAGAPGKETTRLEVCKLMIQKLDAKTPNTARLWLLKQLQQIGRGECVDAVAAVLEDKDAEVHDAAVRCLAVNPAPEATAKLVAKLPTTTGKFRVGLVNALGYRADKTAVDALAKELTGADNATGLAAARALGKIATPEAGAVLDAARAKTKGQLHQEIADAWLRCADRWMSDGKTEAAAAVYKALNTKEESRPVRLAALEGTLKSAGDKAGDLVLQMMNGDDADARDIATGIIEDLSPNALKTVAQGLAKLPAGSQVAVLGALASRGDKSQASVALAAAKSDNESIKRAGLLALGKLGDATVVPFLLESLKAKANLASAAKQSLTQIPGLPVDELIVTAMAKEKTADLHIQLIDVLETRRAAAAVTALLNDAQGEDAAVRKRAMRALQQLAEPDRIPLMVKGVLKAAKGTERDDAERAVVEVCNKILDAEKRPDAVLVVYQDAGQADRPALLPLLGRVGGAKALVLVRSALAGSDAAMAEGAVYALCNWPDRTVTDDLMKLVQEAKDANRKQMTFRALVRVNSLPTDGDNGSRLATLKKAMDLAYDNNDRKAVLQGLAFVKDIETLRCVVPYLDNKELSHEACKTVVELAHSKKLREPNQAEFVRALDRVIELCQKTDKGLVERAKGYKQGN
jgi:HEAT repeat protein